MFSGRPQYELMPFIDLSEVDDGELSDLDFKKAESEDVRLPENYPQFYKGGDVGVLIVHGFTGSPLEMQPLADYLQKAGFSTYQVRVAGHGSEPANLNLTTYEDWYESARYGYFILRRNCKKVYILGESMGGLVALSVAAYNDTDGTILLSPCIKMKNSAVNLSPFLRHFVKIIPKVEAGDWKKELRHIYYDKWPVEGIYQLLMYTKYISTHMEKMDFPMLGFQFMNDAVVSGKATKEFFENAPAEDKKLIIFPNKKMKNHILVSEKNVYREEMFTTIAEWLNERGANDVK
ncbi:alpha/beta hydrolase [Deferribacteres bacterium DY0037]|nr:alpha/beta fold hydrolase [Denitrovibrio acetiphilus]